MVVKTNKVTATIFDESVRRLEGLACIVGSLTDTDDKPELEIVNDVLIEIIAMIKAALKLDGKDVE